MKTTTTATTGLSMTSQLTVDQAREMIAELCRNFYSWGWVSGTGGGISIKAKDGSIVMAPSGVQKERMEPDDMFVLDSEGAVLQEPKQKGDKPMKLSECSPLFMAAYKLRGAGAVMHSHSVNAVLATMLEPQSSEFRVTNLEMIKGIIGHTYFGGCVVPIIENTARECELTERLSAAIEMYPDANAVLVRRHGVYVWGPDWIKAKTQAECYDYLFEIAVKMRGMGINAAIPPKSLIDPDHIIHENAARKKGQGAANGAANGTRPAKRARVQGPVKVKAVVLDIEGTIAPVTFVSDVLFPYARAHVRGHLERTFDSEETQEDIKLIRQQAEDDIKGGIEGAVSVPASGKEAVIEACVKNVEAMMGKDRKTMALKSLQGHVWRAGYEAGELEGTLFEDARPALESWAGQGLKTYIYSSGSREAQRLLFSYSNSGDVRPLLSGYFDTTIGAKTEAGSYRNIVLTLGVDQAEEVVFVTDNVKEVDAAAAAGLRVALAVREGNPALPSEWSMPAGVVKVTSMDQLVPSMPDAFSV